MRKNETVMSISYEEYRQLVARTDFNADCPVKRLLGIFSGKWHIRIIFELTKVDTIRFGELKKRIGNITNTMLAGTLKELEEDGIVIGEQFNEIPPHVEYSLSESVKQLYPVFYEMVLWVADIIIYFSTASYTRSISPTLQAWAKQPLDEDGFFPSYISGSCPTHPSRRALSMTSSASFTIPFASSL